jgi:hypothetical protein
MNITKSLRTAVLFGGIALTTAFFSGCGGLSDAQIKELSDLKSLTASLEAEANSLRDERAKLELRWKRQTGNLLNAKSRKKKQELT